ncbi:MAG: Hsp70 family protein, partial [Burkholderiaceae bacterium]
DRTGVEASIVVKPSYGLSDDEVARMLQDSFGAAESDMHARALREQRVDAERLIESSGAALAADGDLLEPEQHAEIDRLLGELVALAHGTDLAALKAGTDKLSAATEDFAARRMDRSIRAVLAGRRVDDLNRL